ncbi:NAD(P)-dependent oxidoreductase [Euryarchaeota archaeon]|jgi:nucleoside-diphosphate-sugar epimerase|nr:NAD(P)-dependent oxidoreductase [Euryarchaeota archaeon]MDB4602582.1 NAD(P)-dependent oxidoreductase [Euryarchaeota archaeon]MDG1542652.1 NAD(P)-dependent oxidoreductase [Candidatus Thalassarchaeaceae archaeon]
MNVAITASDAFVAPFIVEMLGKSAVIIPDEAISDQLKLDAMLTPCNALIHINSRPVESSFERNDRQTKLEMMNAARPILDAVDRHGSLHLIIIGTLRVHPQWEPGEPFYGLDSTLAPRDTAAEGQLWMEENALDRAQTERPVSVIRASNVQGVPLSGPPGNGLLHRWANECQMGWINVPGDGSNPKDFIHVEDLVQVIGGIIQNPPLTREEIAVGSGKGISMHDLANIYQSKTGCEIELNQRDDDEVFGVVDAWVLEERLGFRPRISLEEMIDEAFEAVQ